MTMRDVWPGRKRCYEARVIADKTLSRLEIRVRFCETDLMGIVHHGNYLAYFEAGRVEWLRKRGVTYASWAARGLHLPVVDVEVRYRIPVRFDDVLTIETRLSERRGVSLRFTYRVLRGGELVAEGSTRLACVNEAHTLTRIPDDVVPVLDGGEIS
jgi:acyl-CoA thioester hydrolase